MNQVADDNVGNIKCGSKNSKKKNKKAKDLSNTPREDELCEKLANNVHINNINNCNLTNGTSDYGLADKKQHPNENVNNAQNTSVTGEVGLCHITNYENGLDNKSSTSQMQIVRTLVEEALENFENSLQEQQHHDIEIVSYESEIQMPEIMRLIQKDLSEPYSIYTYRYFIHNWPKLCFLAMHEGKCIGAIVCKLDMHRNVVKRGYIAMLAVDEKHRRKKIGSRLVQKAIRAMANDNADEVVLETEITNKSGLKLYENLGFVRDKRLFRYYLNGVDALRLKLWLR